MDLIGEENWWMPRWLDRAVPKLHAESRRVDTRPAIDEDDDWTSPAEIEVDDDGVRL
jgi:hypothetical protein